MEDFLFFFDTETRLHLSMVSLSSLKKLWLNKCSLTAREGCESHRDPTRHGVSHLFSSTKLGRLQQSVPF